jgi:hypothetical protein
MGARCAREPAADSAALLEQDWANVFEQTHAATEPENKLRSKPETG